MMSAGSGINLQQGVLQLSYTWPKRDRKTRDQALIGGLAQVLFGWPCRGWALKAKKGAILRLELDLPRSFPATRDRLHGSLPG